MMATVDLAAYPKTLMLRDGSTVEVRLLQEDDKVRLRRFFERIPEEDRYYLKESVTAPWVILEWTSNIDLDRVFPVVAVAGDEIVADATLHRSRSPARGHVGELRIVVDPEYRERGLGRRLIQELLDISDGLGLTKVFFELVAQREEAAIMAAISLGFREVATLTDRVRDMWGNFQDLVLLEMPMADRDWWWRY
jgi:L-amino acid N-acyltransferase YncA